MLQLGVLLFHLVLSSNASCLGTKGVQADVEEAVRWAGTILWTVQFWPNASGGRVDAEAPVLRKNSLFACGGADRFRIRPVRLFTCISFLYPVVLLMVGWFSLGITGRSRGNKNSPSDADGEHGARTTSFLACGWVYCAGDNSDCRTPARVEECSVYTSAVLNMWSTLLHFRLSAAHVLSSKVA